jgi:hypothetical protein
MSSYELRKFTPRLSSSGFESDGPSLIYNNKPNTTSASAAAAAAQRKVGFKPPPPKGPKRGSQGPSLADRQTMAGTAPPPRKSQAPINARVPNRKSAPEVAQRPGMIAQLVS